MNKVSLSFIEEELIKVNDEIDQLIAFNTKVNNCIDLINSRFDEMVINPQRRKTTDLPDENVNETEGLGADEVVPMLDCNEIIDATTSKNFTQLNWKGDFYVIPKYLWEDLQKRLRFRKDKIDQFSVESLELALVNMQKYLDG